MNGVLTDENFDDLEWGVEPERTDDEVVTDLIMDLVYDDENSTIQQFLKRK